MKKLYTLMAVAVLAFAIGCATQKTATGTPSPPTLTPQKVAALEGIACNLGKDLVPNLSTADQTRVTNGCNALQTATTNWQNGKGTSAEVLQASNDAVSIWQSINLGSSALNAKIAEVVAAFQAIVVVLS